MESVNQLWIKRIYEKCSGCRRCEIACSLYHEGKIWPEASRVRVFMFVPGVEIPHLCFQCDDYPCVQACPEEALSVDDRTGAVITDKSKCTACGTCIDACPGRVPHLHPQHDYIVICDLCGGNPKCTVSCQEGKWDSLVLLEGQDVESEKAPANTPKNLTYETAKAVLGEKTTEEVYEW
ncbi:MAG: 4Fe-4S dicluster domain-containing protein [Candidatus Lokiarchaeota archaeon]|nr:4Fe-4S dicluster domain-containing protein [Candidatus Lokiarchaeota archaeon]